MLRFIALSVAPIALSLSVASTAVAADQPIAGLREPARVTVDGEGISHVVATNDHDLYFMQGWVHAGERLFQMDYNRRLPGGPPAGRGGAPTPELLRPAALPTDVQLRTLGMRRSAERSYDAASPFFRAVVE